MKTHLVCSSLTFQKIHFTLTVTDRGYWYLQNLKRHCKPLTFFSQGLLVSRDLHKCIYIILTHCLLFSGTPLLCRIIGFKCFSGNHIISRFACLMPYLSFSVLCTLTLTDCFPFTTRTTSIPWAKPEPPRSRRMPGLERRSTNEMLSSG